MAAREVNVAPPQRDQLAAPEPGEGGDQVDRRVLLGGWRSLAVLAQPAQVLLGGVNERRARADHARQLASARLLKHF